MFSKRTVVAIIMFMAGAACNSTPPPATPSSCVGADAVNNILPAYTPSLISTFMTLENGRFSIESSTFTVRGVNYYPARYPWRRFLTEADLSTMQNELLLLHTVGFNTLRLFLWNEALFNCSGTTIIPDTDAFTRLDLVIHESAASGFRLIVTLNDLPDDSLYTDTSYTVAQTRFIIERYRDEAAILAWDLRNEGDIDYGSNDSMGHGKVSKEAVLNWLSRTAQLVRGLDNRHLITAGWLHDTEATAPDVDFLSFHHWSDAASLRDRITTLKQVGKPILLEEFGYSTFRISPEEQSRMIDEAIAVSDSENLLGWLIWTAFDFPLDATCTPPACPSQDNAEHHFGLWYPDYTAKPIVQLLLGR